MRPTSVSSAVTRLSRLGAAAACALVLTVGRTAAAQSAPETATLRFDAAGALALTSPYGQADVGRLQVTFLSVPGSTVTNQAVDVFCVDLLHNVSFDPSGWTIYRTNLGSSSLAYTRQGAETFATGPDALTRYRKAAWLVDQYAHVSSLTDTTGIQAAMWLQFSPSLDPYGFANAEEEQATGAWQAAADAFAGSDEYARYDWSRFTVLTDVNAVGTGIYGPGMQEFLTSTPPVTATPEPTTLALLGVSLLGMGAVARRLRRPE